MANPVAMGSTTNNSNNAQYESGTQNQNVSQNTTSNSDTASNQVGGNQSIYGQVTGNTYTGQQAGLQSQLLSSLSNYISTGAIPQGLVDPSQVTDAYTSNFNQSVAPTIAAEYGAGSPQIASNENLGMTQLLGNLWSQGNTDYQNAISEGTTAAYTPIGQQVTGNNQSTGYSNGNSNTNSSEQQNSDSSGSWQANNTAAGAALVGASQLGSAATSSSFNLGL